MRDKETVGKMRTQEEERRRRERATAINYPRLQHNRKLKLGRVANFMPISFPCQEVSSALFSRECVCIYIHAYLCGGPYFVDSRISGSLNCRLIQERRMRMRKRKAIRKADEIKRAERGAQI